jgi:2-amino-4-hydroxy-6-hydroxymethyldihydropteridine diphosphokinase
MPAPGPVEHTAIIALGANLGDRRSSIESALTRLHAHPAIKVERQSSLLETRAVGGPPGQPDYLNGAAELSTTLSACDLLKLLMDIEKALGRDRSTPARNLPRTIDLDLLFYDQVVLAQADLILPHPRLHERDFVLIPLMEIAPHAVHPVLRKTIEEMWCDWRRAHPL